MKKCRSEAELPSQNAGLSLESGGWPLKSRGQAILFFSHPPNTLFIVSPVEEVLSPLVEPRLLLLQLPHGPAGRGGEELQDGEGQRHVNTAAWKRSL